MRLPSSPLSSSPVPSAVSPALQVQSSLPLLPVTWAGNRIRALYYLLWAARCQKLLYLPLKSRLVVKRSQPQTERTVRAHQAALRFTGEPRDTMDSSWTVTSALLLAALTSSAAFSHFDTGKFNFSALGQDEFRSNLATFRRSSAFTRRTDCSGITRTRNHRS